MGMEWKLVRWEEKMEWKRKCDQFGRGGAERKGKEEEKRKRKEGKIGKKRKGRSSVQWVSGV